MSLYSKQTLFIKVLYFIAEASGARQGHQVLTHPVRQGQTDFQSRAVDGRKLKSLQDKTSDHPFY